MSDCLYVDQGGAYWISPRRLIEHREDFDEVR